MRAVLQRVKNAAVTVDGEIVGKIGPGLLVLIGIHKDDTLREIEWMTDKIINLRVFETEEGKLDKSLLDTGGELLLVSQFTLYGDCSKGRRPSSRTPWALLRQGSSLSSLWTRPVKKSGKWRRASSRLPWRSPS